MNMQQIEYFVTCAARLNFQKAAKYHYTSVSTISRNISALEIELGAKLFAGELRKASLTWEGIYTFDYIMDIMGRTRALQERLKIVRSESGRNTDCFRIASYAFDGTFSHLVNVLDWHPYFKLEKQIRFDFVLAGDMLKTVLDDHAQMGIETAAQLPRHMVTLASKSLFSSPFQLLVGLNHPLARRKHISVNELLKDYGTYGAFVFDDQLHAELLNMRLYNEEDLQNLGEMTIRHLPRIFNKYSSTPAINAASKIMIIVPKVLRDPHFRQLQPVEIVGKQIRTEYKLFWKRNDPDPDIDRLLEFLSYADCSGQKTYDRCAK